MEYELKEKQIWPSQKNCLRKMPGYAQIVHYFTSGCVKQGMCECLGKQSHVYCKSATHDATL